MQLLWRGIAAYVFLHHIDLMFGCASLPGTDPDALATELTYLYAHHLAPAEMRPRALPHRYVEMRRLDPASLDPRRALAKLPPLIKGYLRLGGFVGDGAVIDAPVQHHRCRRGGEDRTGHREIPAPLRASGARFRRLTRREWGPGQSPGLTFYYCIMNFPAEAAAITQTAPPTSPGRPARVFTSACTIKPMPMPAAMEKVKGMAMAVTMAGR